MADGSASPLPFPSPSAILGDNAPPPLPDPAIPPTNDSTKRVRKHTRSPSKKDNAKKAAPKKTSGVENGSHNNNNNTTSAATDAVKDGKVDKPKQTKSRNGCHTCKMKRLKCGEEKPACSNCLKRGVECGGYRKQFQWREFGNAQVKTNLGAQKQATSRVAPARNPPAASSNARTPPGKAPSKLPSSATPDSTTRSPPGLSSPPDHNQAALQQQFSPPQAVMKLSVKDHHHRQDSVSSTASPDKVDPDPTSPGSSPHGESALTEPHIAFNPDSTFVYRTRSFSTGPNGAVSPSLTEMLTSDMPHALPHEHETHLDFVPFSMPDDIQLPLWSAGSNEHSLGPGGFFDDPDLIGPIQPINVQPFSWPSRFATPGTRSPGSSSLGIPDMGMWNGSGSPLYPQPDLPFDSDEVLLTRYDKMTCGVLSIIDGPTENPWRSLIWPLAQSSPGLYHSILALTAFHGAQDTPRLRLVGGHHKSLAIQNIHEGIRDNSMGNHTAIATALALGFAEAWDRLTDTGNAHIKGAQILVKQALEHHHHSPHHGVDLARLKFLCNAWVYMDVIARLTCVDSNDDTQFDNALWPPEEQPELALGSNRPGFGIDFGMPIDARLDPLMGCAGTLFPYIGHVANLVRKVCRTQRNPIAIISTARDLMEALERWEPPAYIERPEDSTTDVQHALQTAEAYRYATMLHLHQAVPELPTPFSDEQFAQRVLQYLATVPLSSRTLIVHIYPLLVSGCQATENEDREWVRQRWNVMAARMRIGIIDKCLAITEEVWRRRDQYEAKPAALRKLVATADLQGARERGAPLDRPASEVANVDPGRTGVVFSYVEIDGSRSPPGSLDMTRPSSSSRPPRTNNPGMSMGKIDMAYSVRGHLHWVGVMWDWSWEVLL